MFGFAPAIPSAFDCCGPVAPFIIFPGQLHTDAVSLEEEAQPVFFYEQRSGDVDERSLGVEGF